MRNLRIGLFLGLRQIQRASRWATLLIITVILFTFLNLVLISGILIGLVDGAIKEVRVQVTGDITIKPLDNEIRIKETQRLVSELSVYPEIASFSVRYIGNATIEANYKERRDLNEEPDYITTNITGINPVAEDITSGIGHLIQEGAYLNPDESGYILIGRENIDRYAAEYGNVFESLKNIYPGDSVRVSVGENSREFIVKGIVNSKIDAISFGIYLPEREFRRLFERPDYDAEQIAIRLHPGEDEVKLVSQLQKNGFGDLAKLRTYTEEMPKFITDVRDTFNILGFFIGAIGVIVASITIFIIIFINALSRRRQIGILKAIGITREAIQYAYVTQASFYSLVGSGIGVVITYYILIPYFIHNPIDFPFSDASLSITSAGLGSRVIILFIVTLVAGLLPAWMIARQNTLSAILGKK